jgi:hypothetical protein
VALIALAWASTASAQSPPALFPAERYGSLHYYRFRNRDFLERNPSLSPPDYYLSYGDKYIRRFTFSTRPALTAAGRAWLERTRALLQAFIEEAIVSDPAGFALLETDGAAFRAFAFSTHPDAYWEAGLAELPIRDLLLILFTPDVADLLSDEGRAQTRDIELRLLSDWAERAARDSRFLDQKGDELMAAIEDPLVVRAVSTRFTQLLRYLRDRRYSFRARQRAIDGFWEPYDLLVDLAVAR